MTTLIWLAIGVVFFAVLFFRGSRDHTQEFWDGYRQALNDADDQRARDRAAQDEM